MQSYIIVSIETSIRNKHTQIRYVMGVHSVAQL